MAELKKRMVNCLLGGAIGDALGAPFEFAPCAKGTIPKLEEGFDGGVGVVTDDTQMTLFTLEACIDSRVLNKTIEEACWSAYRRWLLTQTYVLASYLTKEEKHFENFTGLLAEPSLWIQRAPGNTCISAMANDKPGTTTGPINNSKGCGGVMRVAPIAFAFLGEGDIPFDAGCNVAALTHSHLDGWLPAGVLCEIISGLASGGTFESSVRSVLRTLERRNVESSGTGDLLARAISMIDDEDSNVSKLGEGWVGDEALAIGLVAAYYGLRDGAMVGYQIAIEHAGDVDSTGSIAGQIMGAAGVTLPPALVKQVEHSQLIEDLVSEFFNAASLAHSRIIKGAPKVSMTEIENALCLNYTLNEHVARELRRECAGVVGCGIAASLHPDHIADNVMAEIGDRFLRILVDDEPFHGTAIQIVEQMRDKSVLHTNATVESYVGVVKEGLEMNGVNVSFTGTSVQDKCSILIETSIIVGLSELVQRGVR